MRYKNFLITRFNIKINYQTQFLKNPKDNPMLKILNEDYLEKRFYLFEKYTFNSVKNQTNQDFTWLILFHKKTPKKYLKKIQELKLIYDFEDLYFDDDENFNFSEYCTKNYNEYDFYITTRLDNDDCIDKDYLKYIRDFAEENSSECFFSFPTGMKYDLETNKKYMDYRKDNHFISLISPNIYNNILMYNHAEILNENIETVFFETTKPMWFELVHDSNVYNDISKNNLFYEIDESKPNLINSLLNKYITARIDIKNMGSSDNTVELLYNSDENALIDFPNWFSDEKGKGMVLHSRKGKIKLLIKCHDSGNLVINFMGIDYRDNFNNFLPIYIKYTNILINEENINEETEKIVWHNSPFVFRKQVEDGEIIKINVSWRPI